jgi:adenylate cyclase
VKLSFDLPLVEYRVRDIYAKIVGRKMRDGRAQLGVEFTSIPPEANQKIQLFVQLLIFTDLN